ALPSTPAPVAPAEAPPPAAEAPAAPAPQAVEPETVSLVTAPAPPTSTPIAPSPAPSPSPALGYTHARTLTFNPHLLRWVPAGAVVLIFFLQFFPWVGVFPGGVPAAWQNAWQAAFGSYGEERDMREMFQIYTPEELAKLNKDRSDKDKIKDNRPGVGLLTVF